MEARMCLSPRNLNTLEFLLLPTPMTMFPYFDGEGAHPNAFEARKSRSSRETPSTLGKKIQKQVNRFILEVKRQCFPLFKPSYYMSN